MSCVQAGKMPSRLACLNKHFYSILLNKALLILPDSTAAEPAATECIAAPRVYYYLDLGQGGTLYKPVLGSAGSLAGPDTQPMRYEGAHEEADLYPPLPLLIGPEAALAVD